MPLINCEINLILTWSENCVLTSKTTRDAGPDAEPSVATIDNTTNATFKQIDTKLYVRCYFINWKWQKTFRTTKNTII